MTSVDYHVALQGQPAFTGTQADPAVPAHVQSPAGVPVDVEFDAAGTFLVPSDLPSP